MSLDYRYREQARSHIDYSGFS
ncbi:hypothetical protein EMIT0P228_100207 [Pseudomonas brassicacearum]